MPGGTPENREFGAAAAPTPAVRAAVEATVVLARQVEAACGEWLTSLGPRQRAQATFAPPGQSEQERLRWFYTPTDHGGLPLTEQRPHQQGLAMKMLATALSEPGYVTVATIMGLENILDRLEGWSRRFGRDRGRDPAMYSLSVFGTPGDTLWGWRFGGHHISISQLISNGLIVSTTPFFLGADPAEAPLIGGTLRPLGSLQDVALDLVASLDKSQVEQAVIYAKAPPDIIGGTRPRLTDGDQRVEMDDLYRRPLPDPREAEALEQLDLAQRTEFTADDEPHLALTATPSGIAGSDMTSGQRGTFRLLLEQHFARVPDVLANTHRARYETDEQLGALRLAWAGELSAGEPHYYRVQGPGILLEYDNTQRGSNHIHSAWRDPQGDFGADFLAAHRSTHPHS
jgi:uncharacterized protein DUF3500